MILIPIIGTFIKLSKKNILIIQRIVTGSGLIASVAKMVSFSFLHTFQFELLQIVHFKDF